MPSKNTGSGLAASSEYCSGQFLSNLNTDFFPILNREDVVSQPVNEWDTGKIWQTVGDKDRLSSLTGIWRQLSFEKIPLPYGLLKSSQKFTFDGQMVIFYYRKHPNTSLHLCVIDFTILDRSRTFRNILFEKMWLCHLFSKYNILKRSLNSLNYYYLIFLSRISTRFILYTLLFIFMK